MPITIFPLETVVRIHSTQAAQSDIGRLIGTGLARPTFSDTTTDHMGSSCLHHNKRVQRSWFGENNWVADGLATVKPGHIYPTSRQNDINQAVSKSTEARAPLTKPRTILTGFHTQNTQGDAGGQLWDRDVKLLWGDLAFLWGKSQSLVFYKRGRKFKN